MRAKTTRVHFFAFFFLSFNSLFCEESNEPKKKKEEEWIEVISNFIGSFYDNSSLYYSFDKI